MSSLADLARGLDAPPQCESERRPELDMGTLAGRLRAARLESGRTQTRLAEEVGTSQAVVQKIENGQSLRPRILAELAKVLNVPVEWLAYGVAGEPCTLFEAYQVGYAERSR